MFTSVGKCKANLTQIRNVTCKQKGLIGKKKKWSDVERLLDTKASKKN